MKKRFLALIVSVCLVFGTVTAVFAPSAAALPLNLSAGQLQYAFISSLADYIVQNYKFDITRQTLMEEAFYRKLVDPSATLNDLIYYMMELLDDHSMYLTEEEYMGLLQEDIEGEVVGIGVTITEKNGRVVVMSPIKDSPAFRAGIKPNDIIISIDGKDTSGLGIDAVRELVLGEIGTSVKVGILRGEETLFFDIMRDTIKDIPVTYDIKKNGIGYIAITSFNKNVCEAVDEALLEFDKHKIKKIVIDLRYNPGGELDEVIELCRKFVPRGVIATIDYSELSGREDEVFTSTLLSPKYKLAVLINDGTASASELFSGAVQDTGVGKIFGTTSYGKGTVQEIIPLTSGGGIRLTVAEYKTRSNKPIHRVGITPDVVVRNTYRVMDTSHFKDLTFERLSVETGDTGEDVLAIEQRLEFLGYMEEADDKFDAATADAVTRFQTNAGLVANGRADFNTLLYLSGQDYSLPVFVDKQLEAAVSYLSSIK